MSDDKRRRPHPAEKDRKAREAELKKFADAKGLPFESSLERQEVGPGKLRISYQCWVGNLPFVGLDVTVRDPSPWWQGPLDWCLYQGVRFIRWITGGMLGDWLTGTPAYRTGA